MSKIFISYRREDSGAACSHIYDRLKDRFGKENIFKDVDSIPYGVSFPDYIAQKMTECGVALILIGPLWETVTKDGRRRLDDPADNVRVEVEKALDRFLAHEMLVMPVLVQNASVPDAARLPESVRLLCRINGPQIHDDPYFDFDMERLIAQIARRLESPAPTPSTSPVTPATPPPGSPPAPALDPAIVRVRQATPLIEVAVAAEDWIQVLDRCRYLKTDSSEAMPAALWLAYGRACLEEGEATEGRSALETALARAPDDLETLRALARACHAAGDDAAADTHLRRALGGPVKTDAERLDVLREYLPVLDTLKHWTELLRRATEGGRLAPDESRWLRAQLRALQEMNRREDALTVARTLTSRADATAGDWLVRARLAYAVAGNATSEEVRAALDAASRLIPANNAALLRARDELLPPSESPPHPVSMPPERLPRTLADLGFAGYVKQQTQFILPPVCTVTAGPFWMGSDPRRDREAGADEQPVHQVTLPAYQIGRFPVTVAEYACFVASGHVEPRQSGVDWRTQLTRLDHPIVNVSWHDAVAYAAWLAEMTGQPWRLPTEAEWEKAARWDPQRGVARLYPWGDSFEKSRCNTSESGKGTTTPVFAYVNAGGASPWGALDMAGNVWEWTGSLKTPYPYSASDGREDPNSTEIRALRGGSWSYGASGARAAYRLERWPDFFRNSIGFRLVLAPGGLVQRGWPADSRMSGAS